MHANDFFIQLQNILMAALYLYSSVSNFRPTNEKNIFVDWVKVIAFYSFL